MVLQLKTPDNLKDVYIGIAIVRYTLSVAIFVVNGGILLAFVTQRWLSRLRRPKQRIHPSGCFVINLIVADTMVGAVLLHSLQFKLWPENAVLLAKKHFYCLLRFAVGFLAVCGSHNALLSVVIDRYIAIVHTLRYKDWMTTKTCALMVIASWILPVTGWAYVMLFGNWKPDIPTCNVNTIMANFFLYAWLPTQIILLLSIAVIQICVHVELRRYGRSKTVSSAKIHRSTYKSAKVMLISTIAFVAFYGPYDVAALTFAFRPGSETKLFYDLSCIGTALTFLVNPCLYSFKTESVRRPVAELFACLRKSLSLSNSSMKQTTSATNEPYLVENAFLSFESKRTSSWSTICTSLSVPVAGSPDV